MALKDEVAKKRNVSHKLSELGQFERPYFGFHGSQTTRDNSGSHEKGVVPMELMWAHAEILAVLARLGV